MKKKKETEEAAKVYAEFVASFEDPHNHKRSTKSSFVKSRSVVSRDSDEQQPSSSSPLSLEQKQSQQSSSQPPSTLSPSTTTSKPPSSSSSYKPMPFIKAGEASKPKPTMTLSSRAKQQQKLQQQQQQEEDDDDEENDALALKEARAQKKRNLDIFLEEIKREQEDREDRLKVKQMRSGTSIGSAEPVPSSGITLRAAFEENAGSHDTGDPATTNLYVGNINPTVNEIMLCHEFARFGPIASVKIMWPRTQEEHDRNRNCGFVSFMSRPDAEQALRNLDGKSFHDYIMKVGWGKAVPLPEKPVFVMDTGSKLVQTGLPFNAQIIENSSGVSSKPRAEVTVVKPSDIQHVKVIHRMIERVVKHGSAFEAIIMEREKNNPTFAFLFDNMSEEHIYYRWKLYSILQGDTKSEWRTEPFQMFEGGAWWIPPDVPFDDEGMMDALVDSEDEEKERIREHLPKGVLGKIARQRFESMLRQITFQRGSIACAMAFAIDHADAADEVIDIIIKSLIIPETPLAVKLARIYLVSDILHNSGAHVANAWKYRMSFENRLTPVFEHLNEIYRSISARLKAEQVRRHITNVLSVWETWMVFPKHHIDHLKSTFMKKGGYISRSQSPESNTSITKDDNDGEVDVDGVPLNVGELPFKTQEAEDDDLDGEPMDDVDGEPMADDDEEDVDGIPMNDTGEDVDGEPMYDEDVDGEPLSDLEHSGRQKQGNEEEINDMFT
ncbi:hypothetical protein BDB00DRAFT_846998 [Zychaea mexicana]|uniref:uncharacterized protein n=1 Tax=Zychaea mexicana TaxID=64656 RepID=UPI0022FE57D4|nr:uncharacterized protein BDB00DRAFT_846998 [Zychaea mexicana]KAI9488686.1 hypothetical protein BDB00DRAFT_846998 [Zychaea mexicana]